jgi:endo-1,4-beta-mannosidase
MSDSQAQPFSLGLTYWPRRTGFGWWQAYDRGETGDELAQVAALGCNTVRFCLRWEDFQPSPRRVNSAALNALEHALDAAQATGLEVVAALFPVANGGALQLPGWANGADPIDELRSAARLVGPTMVLHPSGGPSLLYDGGYRTNRAGDLFTDTRVLDAQRYLIRELAGYFRSHPALKMWQIGEGLERVHKPSSAQAVAEWFATMAEALRQEDSQAHILGGASVRGLTASAGPRPIHIVENLGLAGVAADPPQMPKPERPNHASFVVFLHALTAALAERPVIVTSLGLPTIPDRQAGWINDTAYGRPLYAYRAEPEEQASFIETALDRLHRDGARGAWLTSYADYPQPLWRTPPLDRAIRERTLGIVDAEGREKPAADALRRFAARRPAVVEIAPPIEVDTERYWRDPKRSFEELWREFISEW